MCIRDRKGDMLTDEMIEESIGAAREQMVCVNHVQMCIRDSL